MESARSYVETIASDYISSRVQEESSPLPAPPENHSDTGVTQEKELFSQHLEESIKDVSDLNDSQNNMKVRLHNSISSFTSNSRSDISPSPQNRSRSSPEKPVDNSSQRDRLAALIQRLSTKDIELVESLIAGIKEVQHHQHQDTITLDEPPLVQD